MTDLEQCRALLDRLEIEYIFSDEWNAQGNESNYSTITLVQLASKHTQKWFFYDSIGGKSCDVGKTIGQYATSDGGTLDKQWWPLEEGETRPAYLD
jgi:hypothetical protein